MLPGVVMCTLILPSNYKAEAGRWVHRAFKAIHPNKSNKRVLLILSLETQKGPYPAEKWLEENTRPVCAEKLWKKWGELLETRQKGVLSYSGKKLSELSCWCAKWVWTWSTWIPYWDSWFQSKGVVRFPLLLLFPCKWEDTIWGKDYCAERNKNLMVQKAVYLPRQ